MNSITQQNYWYAFDTYLLYERWFSLMKNIFSKKTEIVLNQYKHLIELSPEPIVVLNEDRIIFANEEALNLFGADNDNDLINNSMLDFVEESHKNKARNSLSKIISSGEDSVIAEVRIVNLKNEPHYIQGIASEIYFENKKAILVMMRDISKMKVREDELEKIAEEAKKIEQMKSQFLMQMSHEIRSPLHAMIIAINLLEEELNMDNIFAYPNYFRVIKSSSRRITKTVDLILNSAELTSNLYNPVFKEVDLNLILSHLITEFKDNADIKRLKLNLISTTGHTKTIGDEYSLMQIFSNLIDNAIKFTDKGQVELILKRDSDFNLIVEITDTGIGISQDYLSKIFNDFTQESNGYSRKFEGAGLGMSVVKKFCDLNDIEIKIASEVGIGTKITLIFITKQELK
ncbi:MAG: ATP-binding protein [Melioribacteraceae bacterium]|nr:MAG: ATP-binding protein [Melioribacteraceae bacterium]